MVTLKTENRQLEIFDLLKVNLAVFAGPLDLLLDLIRKQKMDIHEISLAEICEPYLEQLDLMEAVNIDIAIEFLDIASTLILIKSRSLLPRGTESPEEEDVLETEAQLKQKLLEYQKFQKLAEKLNSRELLGRDFFGRPELTEPGETDQVEIFEDLSVYALVKAYQRLIVRKGFLKPHEVVSETYSLEEKILELLRIFQSGKAYTFRDLCPRRPVKPEIVISFMAILELARLLLIQLQQMEEFSVLHCTPNNNISEYLNRYEEMVLNAS